MTHTNSITFDLAWYSILNQYSASVRRTVCDAVLNFALTGEIPVLKGIAKIAFQFISHEISKQLGKVPVEGVTAPVPLVADMEAPEDEVKDVVEIQSIEDAPEQGNDEPQLAVSQPGMESEEVIVPGSNDDCPVPESAEVDSCVVDTDKESVPSSRMVSGKSYNVPASPAQKARGCISRNRIAAGKMTCTRKGSKILFRRR